MKHEEIFLLVEENYKKAEEKHGSFDFNIHEAFCLVSEEVGEIANAINDNDIDNIENEIIDTITVLIRMLEKHRKDIKRHRDFLKCKDVIFGDIK